MTKSETRVTIDVITDGLLVARPTPSVPPRCAARCGGDDCDGEAEEDGVDESTEDVGD